MYMACDYHWVDEKKHKKYFNKLLQHCNITTLLSRNNFTTANSIN